MQPTDPAMLAFDDLVIDFAGRRLMRGGRELALEPKAFAVLALLAGSPGRVYSRDEILDAVWGHRHVTQSVLNRVMSLLRQALREDAQQPRRLHTVYGVGYRFDLPGAGIAPQPEGAPLLAPQRRPWTVVITAIALALAAIAGLLLWMSGTHPSPRMAAAPSLAVLPFADLSQARDQGYFADGLAEDIRMQLAQAPGLRVVGRASSALFQERKDDAGSIGRKLGVDHLLEGSVRSDGERLRVGVWLIRADDGTQLWSKAYTHARGDLLAVQDEVARDVALALSVSLDVAAYNRLQGGTTHIEAYVRYLQWRSILMREQFDVAHDRQRLQLAREMVALDPACALCWDALASSLQAMAGELGGPPAERLRGEAAQARERIAQVAPDSWLAMRERANGLWLAGRRAEAIALAKAVVDSGPPTKERVWDYAFMIYAMGHLDDTVALVEQARAVEPMALFLSRDLQYDYTAARRHGDAEAEYLRGQTLEGSQADPDYVAFLRQLAGHRPGGLAELRALHDRLARLSDFDTPFFRELGTLLDDRAGMLTLVRRALADPSYGGGTQSAHVWTHVADALGDADLALAALREDLRSQPGFADGRMPPQSYVALWNAPNSSLRAHPGFRELLLQTGVVDYWRQTGRWGDGCAPTGPEDFRCQ